MTRCSLRHAGKFSSVNNFRLEDPGFKSLQRLEMFVFTEMFIPAAGPTKPPFSIGTGVFVTGMMRPVLKLTTDLHLEQKLRINRAVPLLPTIFLQCVDRDNFTYLAVPLCFSNMATHMFTARVIWDVIGGLK